MKKSCISVILSILLVAGCHVTVRRSSHPTIYYPPVHDEPPVVVHNDNSDSIIMQIDAAKGLISESDKREIYMDVVTRPILTERVQVHLINAVGGLISESAKRDLYLKAASRTDLTGNTQIHLTDAAGSLISENSKRDIFLRIAAHHSLAPPAQKHLVTQTFGRFISETAKRNILLTLINNPHFSPEAEKAVYDNLNNIISSSAKKEIIKALADRQRADVNVKFDTEVTYIKPL